MKRILIIGPSGSGKTTLGKQLQEHLGIPYYDLDELYWRPNWKKPAHNEFTQQVLKCTEGKEWIIGGGYSKYRPLFFYKLDTVFWLDLPLKLTLWRIVKRSFRQVRYKETCCGGNRQTVKQFLWLVQFKLRTNRKKRRSFNAMMQAHPDIKWLRIHSQKELDAFFSPLQVK